MIRKDKEATIAQQYLDRRSYVANWKHEGTNHGCVYLFGEDMSARRVQIFEREKGKCQNCGFWTGPHWGELHHIKGGLGNQRCSCFENLAWSCAKCHHSKHIQVMWSNTGLPGSLPSQ
jgi:hypothetical protein